MLCAEELEMGSAASQVQGLFHKERHFYRKKMASFPEESYRI